MGNTIGPESGSTRNRVVIADHHSPSGPHDTHGPDVHMSTDNIPTTTASSCRRLSLVYSHDDDTFCVCSYSIPSRAPERTSM